MYRSRSGKRSKCSTYPLPNGERDGLSERIRSYLSLRSAPVFTASIESATITSVLGSVRAAYAA
jgi:hypothetical protein